MRLIDAEAFEKQVVAAAIMNGYALKKVNALSELIEKQPTAYDVDKVVDQLQEMKEEDACKNISCVLCKYTAECMAGEMGEKVAIDRAIAIVQGGEVA